MSISRASLFLLLLLLPTAPNAREPDARSSLQVFIEAPDERGKYLFFGVAATAVVVCLYQRCWREAPAVPAPTDPDALTLTPPDLRRDANP